MDNRDRDDLDLEDPLGIAQEPVAPDGRIRASNDEASVRRRRKRALGEDVEDSPAVGGADDPEGATGIDMGAGGDGHGVNNRVDTQGDGSGAAEWHRPEPDPPAG